MNYTHKILNTLPIKIFASMGTDEGVLNFCITVQVLDTSYLCEVAVAN